MNDFVLSLIRTWSPIVVGAVISWLLARGIDVGEEIESQLIITFTMVTQLLYYTIIRALESKFPKFGLLLGSNRQPEYEE